MDDYCKEYTGLFGFIWITIITTNTITITIIVIIIRPQGVAWWTTSAWQVFLRQRGWWWKISMWIGTVIVFAWNKDLVRKSIFTLCNLCTSSRSCLWLMTSDISPMVHISGFLHTGSKQSPFFNGAYSGLQRLFQRCWLLLFRLLSAISLLCGQGRLMMSWRILQLQVSPNSPGQFVEVFLVLFQ